MGSVIPAALAKLAVGRSTLGRALLLGVVGLAAFGLGRVPAEATAPTFGVQYKMYMPGDFLPYQDATWATGFGRYLTSGSNVLAASLDLPRGSKIAELEFYFLDNDPTVDIVMDLERQRLDSGFFTGPIVSGSSSGSSASVRTLTLSVPTDSRTDVDPTLNKHVLFITFGQINNANLQLVGARVGFTGPVGTLSFLSSSDRFVDTRPATTIGGKVGPFVGISGDFDFFDFTVTGVPGRDGNIIPAGSTAVVGNVTAIGPTANGLFKILPGGTPCTTGTSTVNFNAGVNTANAFNSGLNSSGELRACFGSSMGATSHLTIDVIGATK